MPLSVPVMGTRAVGDIVTGTIWNSQVRDAVNFLVNPPIFLGYQATAQTIPNGAYTPLAIDTNVLDTYSGHSTSVNNANYYAPISGIWEIFGSVYFNANATGIRGIGIEVNGGLVNYTQAFTAAASGQIALTTSSLLQVKAGSYFSIAAYQNCGGGLGTAASSSQFNARFVHA